MKKILLLIVLIIFVQSTSFSAQTGLSDVVVFSQKNKFGVKDKNGNIIVKPDYNKIIRLGNSSWLVQKKNRFGIMDPSGNYLVPVKYRHADRLYGKFAKLGNEKDFGLYDEHGKAIIPPEYSSIDALFGQKFLTCKDYKYGVVDVEGKVLIANEFEDIYMPKPDVMRIKSGGVWYEVERIDPKEKRIDLPDNIRYETYNNKQFKITTLITSPGAASGYSIVTATNYGLKLFSSISPAYEQTIDDLMLSQGADSVSLFIKLGWLPRFPVTYAKKYANILCNPNNGPLSDVKQDLKKQL